MQSQVQQLDSTQTLMLHNCSLSLHGLISYSSTDTCTQGYYNSITWSLHSHAILHSMVLSCYTVVPSQDKSEVWEWDSLVPRPSVTGGLGMRLGNGITSYNVEQLFYELFYSIPAQSQDG